MITGKLLNTVSLPYSFVKGSFQYRQYKAAQFTHSIINEISGQLNTKGISLSRLSKIIKRKLPKNFGLFVRKNKDSGSGGELNRIYSKNNFIVKQSLELNLGENKSIKQLQIPTIAHEIRHLADSIFHPKFLIREQLIAQKNLDTAKFLDFYDEQIYVKEIFYGKKDKKRILKSIKHNTQKMMRGLSIEDKINLLQNMRYNLISEKNAYGQGAKYAKKLYKQNMDVYEDELYNPSKIYMFDEKIELYKNMAFELIQKARRIHRAKLKKSHSALNKK